MPGDWHIIGNKRRASDIDDTSDEDEQDQARFVLYYNSDSSSVRSCPYLISSLCYHMINIFIRNLSGSLGYKDPRGYRIVMVLNPKDPDMKLLSLYFKRYTHYHSFILSFPWVRTPPSSTPIYP